MPEVTATDASLATLTWRHFPALRWARAKLSVLSKDKKIDIFFRGRLSAMIGALSLYLDSTLAYGWQESSVLAAKVSGHGQPLHRYGHSQSVLEDEDFSQTIQLHLQERVKDGYIRAEDIFHEKKVKITVHTAQNWLHKLEWQYGKQLNGMYIDEHEREDVITYRMKFLQRMKEYMRCMATYDNDGNLFNPQGFQVEGGRKTAWTHSSDKAVPQPKGEGQSLMISDFLTSEWGHLVDGDEEACIIFKAGKNRDGYFASEDLLKQVDKASDIFEGKTKGWAIGLFLFDNAPSHQRRAPDALSAWKMPKNPLHGWTHKKGGPRMHPGQLPNGSSQDFYFPKDHLLMPGWFKGMEWIKGSM
ncbi:hypothetical protein M422DRAFT_243892 [Sphaerobolus stellatus SS14]|nr:hypothetical protein M422DRAFT_243892 [Sphaerobolus stellatus SS14]